MCQVPRFRNSPNATGSEQYGSISFAILVDARIQREAKVLAYDFVKETTTKEAQQWSALKFGKLPVLESNYEGLDDPIYKPVDTVMNSGTLPNILTLTV